MSCKTTNFLLVLAAFCVPAYSGAPEACNNHQAAGGVDRPLAQQAARVEPGKRPPGPKSAFKGLLKVWQMKLPAGAIHRGIGYGFVEDAPGVFMWVYRDDLCAIQYLDSLGKVVYEHKIEEPGTLTTLAGVSENGFYFAKAKDRRLENEPYRVSNVLTIIDYSGKVKWTNDNAYYTALISDDGNEVISTLLSLEGGGGTKFIKQGQELFYMWKGAGFNNGTLTRDGGLYVLAWYDTIYAYNTATDGGLKWNIPMPGRKPWPGHQSRYSFCSRDGRYIVVKAIGYEDGVSDVTYLIKSEGGIIKEYADYAYNAAFSAGGEYMAISLGNKVAFAETRTGELLWSKSSEGDDNYIFGVHVADEGKFIVTTEYPRGGGLSVDVVLKIYDRNGVLLHRQTTVGQDMRYIGDKDHFSKLSADGKYMFTNDKRFLRLFRINWQQ